MDSAAAEIRETANTGARSRLGAYLELTKPRIAFMLVLTSAAGFYLGSGASFDFPLFFHSMFSITLLAFGVAALNQYLERFIDGLMERTARRPLPLGKVTSSEALLFGTLLCVVSEIWMFVFVNALTAGLGFVVIVGYVFLYTPLKTRTSFSTAIGALPGAMPPLMGWTSSAGEITLGAWLLFALLFVWQFPHFLAIAWIYRDQYEKAGIKMLPVVEKAGRITSQQIVIFTIILLPISVGPFFLGMSGWFFLAGSVLLGAWFMWSSIRMARERSRATARKLLLASVLYLPVLFALMVLDH